MAVSFPIKLTLLENMTKRNKGGLGSVCQQESVQKHSVFHVNEKKCGKNQGCCLHATNGKKNCKFVTCTPNQKQNQESNVVHAAIGCNVGHDHVNKKEVSRTEPENKCTLSDVMHLHQKLHMMWFDLWSPFHHSSRIKIVLQPTF